MVDCVILSPKEPPLRGGATDSNEASQGQVRVTVRVEMERVGAGPEALGIGGSDEQAEHDRQLAEGSRLAEEQAARTDAERRGTEAAAQLRADMAQGRVDVFDAGTGQVEIGENVEGSIPRADVAHLVADLLISGRGVHQQFEVVSGPTPIAELPL